MEYFRNTTDRSLFERFIESNPSIEFIRHVWADFSGVLRQRVLTKVHCQNIYGSGRRYGVGPAAMMKRVSDADSGAAAPKQQLFELVPDWKSLRVCEFSPGHGWVMCFIHCPEEEQPLFLCPRQLLAKTLERARQQTDAEFLFGCEFEFTLLDARIQTPQTIDDPESWAGLTGLRDRKLQLLEEIVRALQRSGIEVTHFHVEGFHQLEVSTYPFPPMKAADNILYSCELLRCVATRYGYRATVAVKPLKTFPTNSCGLHFSISRTDDTKDHFLAGIMDSMPLITPFAAPTHDSYRREGINRKGTWICWGTENRDVAIRRIKDGHWEFRLVDFTANFHLLFAVMLNAGLNGIRDKLPLTWGDLRYFSTEMTAEELTALGVTDRLASNFRDSLEPLRNSTEAADLLGYHMKRQYVTVKDQDEEALSRMHEEDRRLQYIKYF